MFNRKKGVSGIAGVNRRNTAMVGGPAMNTVSGRRNVMRQAKTRHQRTGIGACWKRSPPRSSGRVSVLIEGGQWATMWFPVGVRVQREAACAGMLMTNAMSNTVAFGQIGKRSVFIALPGAVLADCLFTRLAEHLVVSGYKVCR